MSTGSAIKRPTSLNYLPLILKSGILPPPSHQSSGILPRRRSRSPPIYRVFTDTYAQASPLLFRFASDLWKNELTKYKGVAILQVQNETIGIEILGFARIKQLGCIIVIAAIIAFFLYRELIDFPVYYYAGRSMLNGRTDLYSPNFAMGVLMDYRYPPLFLLLFFPFSLFEYHLSAYLWSFLSAFLVAGCFWLTSFKDYQNDITKRWQLYALPALAPYYILNLHNGNAHLLVILLMYGSLILYLKEKMGLSALLMALAITIKVVPIILLPYFAVKKQWKFLLQAAIFLIVLNLAPGFYFGWERNRQLLGNWYDLVVTNQEFHEVQGPINLSLKGQLRRYISEVDYQQRISGDVNYPAVNLAAISKGQTDTLWWIGSLLVLSGAFWLIYRAGCHEGITRPGRDDWEKRRTVIELGLMICLSLFIGPQTNKTYFIALLWPMSALALVCRRSLRGQGMIKGVLLLAALISISSSILPIPHLSRIVLAVGVDFYLNLLVMGALGFVLWLNSPLTERYKVALAEARLSDTAV